MLDMNVTLRDLGLLTVFLTLIVAGVFLIRALSHMGSALRAIKKLINDNAEGIDKIIKDLPKLSENAVNLTDVASDIAENLRNEQELIESTLESVSDTIESVSDTARMINEDFIGAIKRLVKTLLTVTGLFTKNKVPEQEEVSGGNTFNVSEKGSLKTDESDVIKPERRERRAKRPRTRSAAPAVRKRQAEKGRNINIHIR